MGENFCKAYVWRIRVSRTYKNVYILSVRKTNSEWSGSLYRHVTVKISEWLGCLGSLVIRELYFKTTVCCTLPRMVQIKNKKTKNSILSVGKDTEQAGMVQPLWRVVWHFVVNIHLPCDPVLPVDLCSLK